MTPPVPQINTFFQKPNKPIIEPISKIFIVTGLSLGINRLRVIGVKNIFITLFVICYSTILNSFVLYLMLKTARRFPVKWGVSVGADCFELLTATIFASALHKRLSNYYLSLNKFDMEIGINAKSFGTKEFLYNLLQLIATLLFGVILYFLTEESIFVGLTFHVIFVRLLNAYELHFYGHLFSLLIPRLKIMKNRMKCSHLANDNNDTQSAQELQRGGGNSHLDMKKLMDCYNKLIELYDCLNETIKWPIMTILVASFVTLLSLSFHIVKTMLLHDTYTNGKLLANILFMTVQTFPLVVPCVYADRVKGEVRMIKDLLACKLYEKTLDKPSRTTARTLLALMETRDLSFSLFHMFDMDISLPFKFTALLLTYLIILLQFDKVITPT